MWSPTATTNGVSDVNPPSSGQIRISVIIPVLNEEVMIGKSLTCLAQSSFRRSCFEVVVVDNGSRDRTLEIVASFSKQLQIRWLQRAGVNISALRNLGAQSARGEILAFLDADCLAPESWLENATRYLLAQPECIVGSRYSIPVDSRWVGRSWYGVGYAPIDGDVAYVPSGDLFIRRSTFLRVGGFDERLATSEDCEFCFRARAAGVAVRAVSELAVIHLGTPQTVLQFYCKHRWHGAHVAKVFLQNMKSVPHLRAVAYALFTLTGLAGVLGGLGAGLILGKYRILELSAASMVGAALACSVGKLRCVAGKRFWFTVLPLTVLYMTYGMARASALLGVGRGGSRDKNEETESDSQLASQ